MRLGETYDPSFLEQVRRREARGDLAVPDTWYRRARDLGANEQKFCCNARRTDKGGHWNEPLKTDIAA